MLFLLALEKLEDSERKVIERLYNNYSANVKELVISLLGNDSRADDVVNDTFVKIIRYKENVLDVNESEQVRFMIICARSICFNILKRDKKIRFEPLESPTYRDDNGNGVVNEPSADVDLLEHIVNEETGVFLQSAINCLDPHARDIVILRYFYEMKIPEIAEFLKMKPGTVKTVIHRNVIRLRKKLEEYVYGTNK